LYVFLLPLFTWALKSYLLCLPPLATIPVANLGSEGSKDMVKNLCGLLPINLYDSKLFLKSYRARDMNSSI
jgi:hypothetical protein